MRIIALANQKGGVGKTTSVINIGAGLVRMGNSVLLVDMDPQANLSEGCGVDPDSVGRSVYEVLMGEVAIESVILQIRDGLALGPSHIDLSGAEAELLLLPGKDQRLKKAIHGLDDFDYILIDCPPSLGQLTLNALTAGRELMIPIQTEFFALKGLKKLLETVKLVNKWSNPNLVVTGIFCTHYDGRKNLNRAVVEELRKKFGQTVFKTLIRDTVALAEAPSTGRDIFKFRTSSYGAEDYNFLCEEILAREDRLIA